MSRNREQTRKALGANQPIAVRAEPHGPFGVLQLQGELAKRLHTSGRAGRPSDPAWTIRRLVGFRSETWEALSEMAIRLSTTRRKVSPGQVAASLIEERVAQLQEGSGPNDGEPEPGVAPRRRKRSVRVGSKK